MGRPVRAEVVLCELFMALLGLISRSWQSKKPAWRNWQRNCLVSRRLQVRFLPSALGQGMHFRYIPTPEMELDHYWSGSTHCSSCTETGRSCTRYTMMSCDDPHQMQDLQVQKSINAEIRLCQENCVSFYNKL